MNISCPVCNREAEYVSGKEIYPHREDLYALGFYRCSEHIDYYVGCHKGTDKPLGVLANKEHRLWKIKCHAIFDPQWKSKKNTRRHLYSKLSHAMNIPFNKTHFGMFTIDQLMQAYEIIRGWEND